MRRRLSLIPAAFLFITFTIQTDLFGLRTIARAQTKSVPAPTDVLGFTPGDDRKLASWAKVVEYFQKLAATSDRVKFEEIGKSTMGAPFVYVTISAPENLKHLDEFKEIQRQLADPRLLGTRTSSSASSARRAPRADAEVRVPSDSKASQLIKRGKTVVAITCGIHSTEVGSYLSSMLIAYRLASSNEPEVQEILKNTIILLVPSTNPDGWTSSTTGIRKHWARLTKVPIRPSFITSTPATMTIATGTRSRRSKPNWSSIRFSTSGIRKSSTTFISRARSVRASSCRRTCRRSNRTCRSRSSQATRNSEIIWRKKCAPPVTEASRPIRLTMRGRLRERTRIITAACASSRRPRRAVSPRPSPSASINYALEKATIRVKRRRTLVQSGKAVNGTSATSPTP